MSLPIAPSELEWIYSGTICKFIMTTGNIFWFSILRGHFDSNVLYKHSLLCNVINLGVQFDGSKEQRSTLISSMLQTRAHMFFPPNH